MAGAYPDINAILSIAKEAGETLRTMQRGIKLMIKPDGSPVTRADMESNRIILRELTKLTPGIGIVSEENDETINSDVLARQSCYWVVDPLDITTNYASGGNRYSINIALIEDAKPMLGVLYFPALDLVYYHAGEGEAYKQAGNGEPEALHVMSAMSPDPVAAKKKDTPLSVGFGQERLREIVSYGQHRACLVAEGVATFCTEQAGFCIWDTAATHAIVRAAGGDMIAIGGGALRYDGITQLPAYMVGHPAVLKALMSTH